MTEEHQLGKSGNGTRLLRQKARFKIDGTEKWLICHLSGLDFALRSQAQKALAKIPILLETCIWRQRLGRGP